MILKLLDTSAITLSVLCFDAEARMPAFDTEQQLLITVDLLDVLLLAVKANQLFQHLRVLIIFAVAVQQLLLGVC